jgi:hypothetical protein
MRVTLRKIITFVAVNVLLLYSINIGANAEAMNNFSNQTDSGFEEFVSNEQVPLLAKSNLGVITQRFEGQGRCSQVCPIMAEVCQAQGGQPGRCWCDEKSGGVTIGHIVCKR